MGYESSLHLIDVKIRAESVRPVRAMLKPGRVRVPSALRFFLEQVVLDREGFLVFKAREDGLSPYVPDEEEGTVPAICGKWYEAERIATWLKQHSGKGGRIVLHSTEGDGAAWGWEFDGRGRMRTLSLRQFGKWG